MYNKWVFVFLNVLFFLFDYIIITMIPNPLVMGIPLQLLCYILAAPVAALLWASYFIPFFRTQKDR